MGVFVCLKRLVSTRLETLKTVMKLSLCGFLKEYTRITASWCCLGASSRQHRPVKEETKNFCGMRKFLR